MEARSRPSARRAVRTYQLEIELAAPVRLSVGRLGVFDFPAGSYVYTGSATRNLDARVAHHLAQAKRLRWHIDYLLDHPAAHVVFVRRSQRPECALNRVTGGLVLVPRFGASDCLAGCGSHLKYLGPRKASRCDPS